MQTITAAERASKLSGQANQMKPNDLIAFIIEEAQHHVINDERTKLAKTALAAHTKKGGKKQARKGKKPAKSEEIESESNVKCGNCKKDGHTKSDCWSKGGGKEGQGPRQKKKSNKTETAIVASNDEEKEELFAFTSTSNYAMVAERLQIPKSKLGTCIDSGASCLYSPDWLKFTNYKPINCNITTADGRTIKAVEMGDLCIDLPNGSKWTEAVFKDAIHAPDMAFTLISISWLDKMNYTVTFSKGICIIKDPKGRTIAIIPHSEGLYHVITSNQAKNGQHTNAAAEKMNINEAHQKLGHISFNAIRHAVSKGYITRIDLDDTSKPEFCEACAKAKSAVHPFLKESETHVEKYGNPVH